MKKDIGYFIDIERLIQWTYHNPGVVPDRTMRYWRNYKKFPSDDSIDQINRNLPEDEKFKKINIAELMICINNAKDHNRGNKSDLVAITSTAKKVITMMLLGRIVDWGGKDSALNITEEKHNDVYKYLSQFTVKSTGGGMDVYHYIPGRTVSFNQLCEFSKCYKNGMTSQGISYGLKKLCEIKLVECVGQDLYKLNFDGCMEFLNQNK